MTGSGNSAAPVESVLRLAILIVFAEGIRRRDLGAVANAVPTFATTYLPEVVERRYGVEFRPWQRAYLDTAMLAHVVGMLGPYDDTRWWDTGTHVLSSTILAGAVHVAARRRGDDPRRSVIAAVACLGILWELLEYGSHAIADRLGVEPVLVPYSERDTAGDLAWNLVGALLVLAFGDRFLGNFVEDER